MPSIALGLRRDTYKHDFCQLWYTLVHHFLSDPSPIIALPCLSLSWVSQFLLLLRLDWCDPGAWLFYSHVVDVGTKQNPCCWCQNKAKPMFASFFIGPNHARWLPCLKASFAGSVCNTNNFLHINYIAFAYVTQIKYTTYLFHSCCETWLIWPWQRFTQPLLALLYRILPNQTGCKLWFVPSFEGRVLSRFWS